MTEELPAAKTPLFQYLDGIHATDPFLPWKPADQPTDLITAIVLFYMQEEWPISFKQISQYVWAAGLRYQLIDVNVVVNVIAEMEEDP